MGVGSMSEITWTPDQSAAIRRTDHTLLTASAGTGKTTTVIAKILWHLGLPIADDESGKSQIREKHTWQLNVTRNICKSERMDT